MITKLIPAAALAAVFLAGCATPPKDIAPAYVSTGLYQNLNCTQLRSEAEGVSARVAAAYGKQDSNRGSDAAMTTVGLVLFWPALFFMKGDGADAAEVARLKGEMQAIEQVNRVKNCGIVFSAA
jgi:outer membrane murein-binding lipoprotein Lpp